MTRGVRADLGTRGAWFLASLLPLSLSGCPLTDDYTLMQAAGGASSSVGGAPPAAGTSTAGRSVAGHGGSGVGGATAGSPALVGGSAGSGGGTGAAGGAGGAAGTTSGSSGGGLGPAGAGDSGGEPGGGVGGTDPGCTPVAEVCDGVSNDCDDEIDEDDVCPSECEVKTYDQHLYVLCLFEDQADWATYPEATSQCADMGASVGSNADFALSFIESEAENDFLKEWITEKAPVLEEAMVWMGANDLEDERTWVWGEGANAERFFDQSSDGGGTPYHDWFNDFAEGKPNSANNWEEDCGGFDSSLSWQWNDFKCSDGRLGYVCEEQL